MDVYQWPCKNILLHLTAHWYVSEGKPGSSLTDSYIINQTLSYRDAIRQFIVHAICYHGDAPSPMLNSIRHVCKCEKETWSYLRRQGTRAKDESVADEDRVEGWWRWWLSCCSCAWVAKTVRQSSFKKQLRIPSCRLFTAVMKPLSAAALTSAISVFLCR